MKSGERCCENVFIFPLVRETCVTVQGVSDRARGLPWLLLPALVLASDARPRFEARPWAVGGLRMACSTLALQEDVAPLGLVAAVPGARAWHPRDIASEMLVVAAFAMAVCARPL